MLSIKVCHIGNSSAFGHFPVPNIIIAHTDELVKQSVPFSEQLAFECFPFPELIIARSNSNVKPSVPIMIHFK